jgi:hypothetical protein
VFDVCFYALATMFGNIDGKSHVKGLACLPLGCGNRRD